MDYRLLSWGFTALFVYLKLVGHVDWSWWWVLSPWIIGFLITIFLVLQQISKQVRR